MPQMQRLQEFGLIGRGRIKQNATFMLDVPRLPGKSLASYGKSAVHRLNTMKVGEKAGQLGMETVHTVSDPPNLDQVQTTW